MIFKFEKLGQRVKELESTRYKDRQALEGWTIHEDKTKKEKYPPKTIPPDAERLTVNKLWEGRDRYFWLMGTVDIPEITGSDEFVLLFDFGDSRQGNVAGFESMLYINGEIYQAVDGNHKEVFFDPAYANEKVQVALRLWGGLNGGGPADEVWHLLKYADKAHLSLATDDLYYTALVMLETIAVLDHYDPIRFKLLDAVDDAFNLIDWSEKGSPMFYASIEQANNQLQQVIQEMEKHSDVHVTMVGHTHIDVAWLWRLKHTREKSARSFATVFRLMEQYPEYTFLQTQPQIYEYIKEDYPELYEKIKEKIIAGQWEVEGAMWLETDANIPSGESLVRQILFGKRFIKAEFNKETKSLWLPDVFGYSWALPQILKKSGIETFMTTKIFWNQFNRMPHDTFYWKGMDGSEILTHFITSPVTGAPESSYTYNAEINPFTVKGVYDGYKDKAINQNLLIAYGYGDGGGGANREQLEKSRRIRKLPGLPNLKSGTAGAYFDELTDTIEGARKSGKYVHTWDGELYLELHRGTYTSQARTKMWNRKLELAFREAEILWSWFSRVQNAPYPSAELNKGWKIILRNQFHDIIPGSSIREVYKDSEKEYQTANDIVSSQIERIGEMIVTEGDTWTLFNTAAWARDELVVLESDTTRNGVFEDEQGNVLSSVLSNGKNVIQVHQIPALGSKTIRMKHENSKNEEKEGCFTVFEKGIETPHYKIQWDINGHLRSVFDKANRREVLTPDGSGNVFQLFEDKPLAWDAWDIDLFYQEKGKDLSAESTTVVETNELFARVEFVYAFGSSTIKQMMTLYKYNRRIDFNTTVDWKERQQLLKVKFDVDVRTTEATYDIQYGNVKRPTHWNTSWDMAKFETIGHQWADISERDYGVSLLNDAKYGYDIKDGTIRLSLLKGAIYPDPEADVGNHEFTYSLYPHKGDVIKGRTVQEAWSVNKPVTILPGNFAQGSLLSIDSDQPIMVDAIKKAEDHEGTIIRLHNFTGGRQQLRMTPHFQFSHWQEVDLMESPLSSTVASNTRQMTLDFKPYEIKTILID